MKFLFGIIFWLIQPLVWLAALRVYGNYRQRIKRERKLFHSAVESDFYEGQHFFQAMIVLGILGSLISLILGLTLPTEWVLLYGIVTAVLLVIAPATTVLPIALTTVIMLANQIFSWFELPTMGLLGQTTQNINSSGVGIVALTTMAIGMLSVIVNRNTAHLSPVVQRNRRNTMVASYKFRELTVVPLVVLVPGDWFTNQHFWPLLTIGNHQFAFLTLPLLIGLSMTVKKMLPVEFFQRLSQSLKLVAGVGIILTGVTIWRPRWWPIMLAVLVIICWLVELRAKMNDNHTDFTNSEVVNGMRVIGIQPNSPAAKMNLQVGDIILEVNNISVTDETEFYRALIENATYCHLKVRDRNDQLKITETAIFVGATHEIGIETFPTNK